MKTKYLLLLLSLLPCQAAINPPTSFPKPTIPVYHPISTNEAIDTMIARVEFQIVISDLYTYLAPYDPVWTAYYRGRTGALRETLANLKTLRLATR
jgi:hypothetical protein